MKHFMRKTDEKCKIHNLNNMHEQRYLSHKFSLNPEDSAEIKLITVTNAARSIFKLISLLMIKLGGVLAIKRCDLRVQGRKMTLYLYFPVLHHFIFL